MSSTTISHVVSSKQSTMVSHVIADDQQCHLLQSIHDDSHLNADDQPCRLFQSIHDDKPCHRRRSAMSSLSINQR
ncbi:hypothetical protein RHMOL_Rhmol11G0049600 [Rhododendron molle]|uniref:Uncharacterized protein n=1 Tax=Rhododendron molle TaxID=49168 RepID=A0ACC0LPU4_RHOML|nr:hypothetical protein RHMOL_Rhmol11G0049600 [Rhododendron molle]